MTSGEPDNAAPAPKPERTGIGAVAETIITVLVAVAAAWIIQAYVIKPYKIPSGSMENTLRCRDRVLVNRVSYHLHSPHRGDVVVFHPPAVSKSDKDDVFDASSDITPSDTDQDPTWQLADGVHTTPSTQTYIKRLIAMPGDTVQVTNRHAFVNGKAVKEPYLHPLPPKGSGGEPPQDGNFGPYKLGRNQYLMLGDNRTNSRDGRWFGPITRQMMIGKAFMVYWPPSHFGGIPKHASGPKSSSDDPGCEEAIPTS